MVSFPFGHWRVPLTRSCSARVRRRNGLPLASGRGSAYRALGSSPISRGRGFPWRPRSLIGFWELGGKCACGGEVGAEVGDGERGMLKYGSDDLASPHAGRLRHISASHVLSHTG
jgi:hypothetical protein